MLNEWLIFSLILLGIWLVIFIAKPRLRKEMFWVSLFTMPTGLTEPLFIPAYWSPPSLFNLNVKIGFDLESLIFAFAVAGIGAVLYEAFAPKIHKKMAMAEMHSKRHRFHKLALFSPAIIFLPLYLLTSLNIIYVSIIALFIGGVAAILCRPDLTQKILYGGALFFALYFVFFLFINLIFPGFVESVWNLSAISGILIVGVPLEELLYAFTFGMMWSSVYEHARWYKVADR